MNHQPDGVRGNAAHTAPSFRGIVFGMALFREKAGVASQVLPLAAHPAKEKGLQKLIEGGINR